MSMISSGLLFAMFSFSLAMSISPGPVNMIILSSGVNFGIQKTLPYVMGATVGFTLLLLFIGLGLSELINEYPSFLKYLAVGGSLYIVYMGYKIATSKPSIEVKNLELPKFYQGFVLQWVNPKAWIACVSGVSIFAVPESFMPFFVFTSIYFVVCYASLAIWAFMGDKVSFLLNNRLRLLAFNVSLGAMLMITAGYILYTHVV